MGVERVIERVHWIARDVLPRDALGSREGGYVWTSRASGQNDLKTIP